jgi:hypothetical protein
MAKKHRSNRHTDYLTNADVYAAIRYLEPEVRRTNQGKNDASVEEQSDAAALLASVIFVILMLGLAFMFFYQ